MSLAVLAWTACALALAYTYLGYPIGLYCLARGRAERRHALGELPRVSLVVSAHNEATALPAKLDNCQELDYPSDRLEVVVLSDASDDGTDDLVRARSGVRLLRSERRVGKVGALNRFLPECSGEVLVLSDANCLYDRGAIRALVQTLDASGSGCVCGELRYVSSEPGDTGAAESTYWGYDIAVKRLESALGSLPGVNGAIYALRREHWAPVPERMFADLVVPVRCSIAGVRTTYTSRALGREPASLGVRQELGRRARNTSRGLRSVLHLLRLAVLRGRWLVAWQLVSHRLMRWLGPIWLLGLAATTPFLPGTFGNLARLGMGAAVLLAVVGAVGEYRGRRRALPYKVFYALALHAALLLGLGRWLAGTDREFWKVRR